MITSATVNGICCNQNFEVGLGWNNDGSFSATAQYVYGGLVRFTAGGASRDIGIFMGLRRTKAPHRMATRTGHKRTVLASVLALNSIPPEPLRRASAKTRRDG